MGHYFEGATDPWLTTTYSSDSSGVAEFSEDTDDFSLHKSLNVFGRTVVVHASASRGSSRVACGEIGMSKLMYPSVVDSFVKYPGSTVTQTIQGVLQVTAVTGSTGVRIKGMLTGLEPGATGGWHVHSGFTCDEALLVGGHYFDGLSADPWLTTTYTADENGVAMVDESLLDFSTQPGGVRSVVGRVVVVHLAAGARAACGVIEPISMPEVQVVSIGSYPGYMGTLAPRGLLIERDTSTGLSISGVVGGLEPSVTNAGWHVHSGYTCADASGVFGHYFPEGEADIWLNTKYTTDAQGSTRVSTIVPGYTVSGGTLPVAKRSIVFHALAGARAGCGELVNALALPMPPPPPSSPPPLSPGESLEGSSDGQSTASAVGIAFGVIAVLSATAVGGFFLYRRFGGPGRGASGTRNNPYATNVYADRKNGDKMAHQVAIDMHVHSKLKPNQA